VYIGFDNFLGQLLSLPRQACFVTSQAEQNSVPRCCPVVSSSLITGVCGAAWVHMCLHALIRGPLSWLSGLGGPGRRHGCRVWPDTWPDHGL